MSAGASRTARGGRGWGGGRGVIVGLLLLLAAHHACSSLAPLPKLRLSRPVYPAGNALLRLRAGSTEGSLSIENGAHSMSVEHVLESLQVTEPLGLSAQEAGQRLARFGPNALPDTPKQSLLHLVAEQFSDRLVQLLVGVAVLSSALAAVENDSHAFTEPVTIVAILVINALVGIWQSRSAEDSLDALKKMQPHTCVVLRDGKWLSDLPAEQLVPGDILSLRVGDKVPADGRLIAFKTASFSTNEASLTGESVSASKMLEPADVNVAVASKHCMVFSGTLVTQGSALAVVTSTGTRTEMGAISAGVAEARATQAKTPLAVQIDAFGDQLGRMVALVCVAIWLAAIPRFWSPAFASPLRGAAHYAKAAVALGVAAVPEGLPAVITLCLSLGTRRLAQHRVIVRKLPAVETLGCTSVICTDKTGTLTCGIMAATSLTTLDNLHTTPCERTIQCQGYAPTGIVQGLDEDGRCVARSPALRQIALACALCSEARLVHSPEKGFDHIGEPTEAALRALGEKLGFPGVRRDLPPSELGDQSLRHWATEYEQLSVHEFSRDRKSMSVLLRHRGDHSNVLAVKGAAEMVLERCSHAMREDGAVVPIDASLRATLRAHINELAGRPLRVLAVAVKSGPRLGVLQHVRSSAEAAVAMAGSTHEKVESELTLVGLCGLQDPARPEARAAIDTCRTAGVRVMMITGDSRDTAVAVARDVGILGAAESDDEDAFVTADFFLQPEAAQLRALSRGNKVFCRAAPRDKQRLIDMLRRLGEVPAMTGDGVNDAPALQQADIGIAMGQTGTEVAKAAADMVLADDNFASIVAAVREGRGIFANLQAFVCFLVSCNLGEVVAVALAALLGLPEPLTPLHLLWVNLVTDGPPATALGFNPSDPQAMTRPPRPRNESLLSPWLLTRYAVTGAYVGAATIGAFAWWFLDKGVSWYELRHWTACAQWPRFAHSAEAPLWPVQPCEVFSSARLLGAPRAMALSVLVTIEMLKALSAVSLDQSLLTVPFWKNAVLGPAVALPFALHLAALYVPRLRALFGLHPLSRVEWKVVLAFALPVLLLEEGLKLVGRRVSRARAAQQLQAKQRAQELLF